MRTFASLEITILFHIHQEMLIGINGGGGKEIVWSSGGR